MNGAYGVGLLAFERIGEMLPTIAGAVVFVVAIWIISGVRA